MTQRVVPAAWALLGKYPGDRGDYRVLRGNHPGGAGQDDLAGQVWAELPGLPQLGSMPGPGALPWATFTPREEDGQRWLAVTSVDATADRDAVGRPAVAIRHVRLAYADVARGGLGYQGLYAALPPADAMTAPLTLALPDAADPGALIDERCFDRAARLAALLLSGEVMITLSDANPLPLTERLAEFDRVLALLPFGLRAGIAVASWHDGSLRDDTPDEGPQPAAFRLAFGPFPTRGQAVVDHDAEVPPPAAGIAERYRQELAVARKEFGLPALIEHLGRHRAPLGADDAALAGEILRSLADPGLVVTAVREGRATVERVLNARRHAGRLIGRDACDELDEYLLAQDVPAAAEEVLSRWSDRTALLAATAVLTRMAAGTAGAAVPAARRLYAHAADHGEQEAFLTQLAERRTRDGVLVPAAPVAALLHDLIGPPHPGELPALRTALLRQPRLGRWQLRLALRGDRNAEAWLEWLSPGPGETAPAWLRPYAVLTTPDASLAGPGGLEADPEDLALIVLFALRDAPAPVLAGPWWPVLLRLAKGDPVMKAAAQYRVDLGELTEAADLGPQPPPVAAVRLDTLRLYVGRGPRHLPLTAGPSSCRRYLHALWEQWAQPPTDEDISALTVRLLESLPKNSSGPEALEVLRAVVADGMVPFDQAVADAVAAIVDKDGMADNPGLTEDWWARVERVRPDVRAPWVRLRAALRRPDADPVNVAVLMGHTAASGASPDELYRITGRWVGGHKPSEVSAMLRIVSGVIRLCADPLRLASCDDYMASLARLLDVPEERRPPSLFRRRGPGQPSV